MTALVAVSDLAASFGHALRHQGIRTSVESSVRFALATAMVKPGDTRELYWIGRVTLLTEHAHVPIYDRVFGEIFGSGEIEKDSAELADGVSAAAAAKHDPLKPSAKGPSHPSTAQALKPAASSDAGNDPLGVASSVASSRREALRVKDFAMCDEQELALVERLIARLALVTPLRASGRTEMHSHGRRPDLRRTLARARRTGGDPLRVVQRRRRVRQRNVVVIVDVSGSMEGYARTYLHLTRAAVKSLGAQAFAFSTRLTPITRALAGADPNVAYQLVGASAPDWAGGTRIGDAVLRFVEDFGRRGPARGAVVVIISDGWEADSPAQITKAMGRLARLAHHIIWVNPRSGAPSYSPKVAGMAAALPFVDTFLSGHSLDAIDEVVEAIGRVGQFPSRR